MALGKDRVVLAHIDWGMFEYEKTRKIVERFAKEHGLSLKVIDGSGKQRGVWRYGPSCNSCTKFVKLKLLKEFAAGRLVLTGSNAYDTWGRTGLKVKDGVYAPLMGVEKRKVRSMIEELGLKVEKIGESEEREGCKLKNLLKMLVNEDFHGRAVAESNEILMDFMEEVGIHPRKAQVKIGGPLSRNVAVVLVDPPLDDLKKKDLERRLLNLDVIDSVVFSDEIIKVKVVASPPIFKNPEARENIRRVIGIEGEYEWILSKNKKLRTFQVVEVETQ